jgi:hypothetical protein
LVLIDRDRNGVALDLHGSIGWQRALVIRPRSDNEAGLDRLGCSQIRYPSRHPEPFAPLEGKLREGPFREKILRFRSE